MRIIFDTNIIIYREDHSVLRPELQELVQLFEANSVQTLIHPLSVQEIENDSDAQRRAVVKSKINSYPALTSPPVATQDSAYSTIVGITTNQHDLIDNEILYALYRDAVDFLLTNDNAIRKKSEKLGLTQRVFNVNEALVYFRNSFQSPSILPPPAIRNVPVHNLNVNDPIFNTLKQEYDGFVTWFTKISREGRDAWVHFTKPDELGALMIYKTEDESILSEPPIPAGKRLKICTFSVLRQGYKIGEAFLRIAIEFAMKKRIPEVYLTHFTKAEDPLRDLLEEYGFVIVSKKDNGEDIYLKSLICPAGSSLSAIEVAHRFYPSFRDGAEVRKFVVPIQPGYHSRLFAGYDDTNQQPELGLMNDLVVEGNTIKKAYLCHAPTKKVQVSSILLFYRSGDEKSITSLGTVETIYEGVNNPEEIMRRVGKRTVYTKRDIEIMASKPTKVIMFFWHFHLKRPLHIDELRKNGIISTPQSIVEISHESYEWIKREGGIDEHLAVN